MGLADRRQLLDSGLSGCHIHSVPKRSSEKRPTDINELARAITIHARSCPSRQQAEGIWSILPTRLAEIVAWMGAQWADTWIFDYETASAKFELLADLIRAEVARYLRARAGFRAERRNYLPSGRS